MTTIVSAVDASGNPCLQDSVTAVFCVDIVAAPLADALCRSERYTLLRSVYTSTEGILSSFIKVTEVWLNAHENVVLFKNTATVQGSVCEDWFSAATKGLNIGISLILDGIYIRHPLAEVRQPELQFMATSAVKARSDICLELSSIKKLTIGQLVTSCSALLMTRYEHTGIPAVLLLSDKELSYTVESAKTFEKAESLISSVLGLGVASPALVPTPQEYSKYVAIDPYLISTGNIYS